MCSVGLEALEAKPQATESALALPRGTGSVEGLVPLAVNCGNFCWELKDLQDLGYKGTTDNKRALGGEEPPFLPYNREAMSYSETV